MLNAWRVQHQQMFFLWAKINLIKKEKQRRREKGEDKETTTKRKVECKLQTTNASPIFREHHNMETHYHCFYCKKKVIIQLVSRCRPLHHMHIEVSWMIHLLVDFPYSYQDAQAWPKPKKATINKQKKEPEIRNQKA